jgi:DNA-binding MarR family transcriptional regulator
MLLLGRAVEEVLDARAVVAASGKVYSSSKVRMLKLIAHSGEQSVGQVARFLGVSDPAASQLAEALVRQRLVTRYTAPEDRRTAYLKLTAAGQKLVQAIEQEQRNRVRTAVRNFSGSTKDWNTFLTNITLALTSADKAAGGYCLQCGSHEDRTCILENGDAECMYLSHSKRRTRGAAETTNHKKVGGTRAGGRKSARRGARRARGRAGVA